MHFVQKIINYSYHTKFILYEATYTTQHMFLMSNNIYSVLREMQFIFILVTVIFSSILMFSH